MNQKASGMAAASRKRAIQTLSNGGTGMDEMGLTLVRGTTGGAFAISASSCRLLMFLATRSDHGLRCRVRNRLE